MKNAERIKGQNEAWELAQKISRHVCQGGYSLDELHEIFNEHYYDDIIANHTYSEAVAKIEAWDKTKKREMDNLYTIHELNDEALARALAETREADFLEEEKATDSDIIAYNESIGAVYRQDGSFAGYLPKIYGIK